MSGDQDDATDSHYEGMVSRQLDFLVGLANAELPKLTDQEAKTRVMRALEEIDARRDDMLSILSGKRIHPRHTQPWYALACFGQIVNAALTIGSYCSIPDSARDYVKAGSARQARAARQKKRPPGADETIARELSKLWNQKPSLRNNDSQTSGELAKRLEELVRQGRAQIPHRSRTAGALRKKIGRAKKAGLLTDVQDF